MVMVVALKAQFADANLGTEDTLVLLVVQDLPLTAAALERPIRQLLSSLVDGMSHSVLVGAVLLIVLL